MRSSRRKPAPLRNNWRCVPSPQSTRIRLPAASTRRAGWLRSADGTLAEVPRNVRANMLVSIQASPLPNATQAPARTGPSIPHRARQAVRISRDPAAEPCLRRPDRRADLVPVARPPHSIHQIACSIQGSICSRTTSTRRGETMEIVMQPGLAADATDWDYGSISTLLSALHARKVSASELIEHTIARIEALDGRINAVVVRDFDRARDTARAADAALGRGERLPLLGIPLTLKEPFNVAGLPTTWGFPHFKDFQPAEAALVVSRLKAAGAVIIGKTNIPIGLRNFQSYNDIYGTTNNPWDFGRSPGGSSGGSGAALAAGFGPLSIGSDIGGSIRVPAHFCGVFGHKPSLGLVPLRGYSLPPAPPVAGQGDLAVVGPMTRTASDLALALDVIAGPDEARDGIGYRLALPAPRHDQLR